MRHSGSFFLFYIYMFHASSFLKHHKRCIIDIRKRQYKNKHWEIADLCQGPTPPISVMSAVIQYKQILDPDTNPDYHHNFTICSL